MTNSVQRFVADAWKASCDSPLAQGMTTDPDLSDAFEQWFGSVASGSVAIGEGERLLAQRLRDTPTIRETELRNVLDMWMSKGMDLADHYDMDDCEEYCDRALRRAILRLAWQSRTCGPGFFGSLPPTVASVMDRVLGTILPRDGAIGSGSPLLDGVESLREWQDWFDRNNVGTYWPGVAFPVELDLTIGGQSPEEDDINGACNHGAIVWARVWALKRPDKPCDQLQIAPWTFYEPDPQSVATARRTLPKALAKLSDDLAELAYVVSLEPISPADIRRDLGLDASLTAWELSPPWFKINGNSLMLAIAVAAFGAAERLSVPLSVATGRVNQNGEVEEIDGIHAKIAAIEKLRETTAGSWTCFFPSSNKPNVTSDPRWNSSKPYRFPTCLKELYQPGQLIDGFDGYRNALIQFGRSTGGASDSSFEETASDFVEVLESCTGHDDTAAPCFVTLPFASSPEQHVEHWMRAIVAREWSSSDRTDFARRPVPIPVRLGRLCSIDSESGHGFVSALLEEQLISVHPDRIAIQNALRRPRKLILIVYDDGSYAVARKMSDESYRRAVSFVKRLTRPRPGIHTWQPQLIVFVASDEHHKRFLQRTP